MIDIYIATLSQKLQVELAWPVLDRGTDPVNALQSVLF